MDVDRPQLVQRDAYTTEAAWCCRTTLPSDVQWHEVVRRQTCTLEGVVIEPWLDVEKATTDELHRPLDEFGVVPQPLLIQYEVDLERSAKASGCSRKKSRLSSGDPWRA